MFSLDYLGKRLRFIASRLTHFDLQTPDPEDKELSLLDIEEFLSEGDRKNHLFLNFYTRTGLSNALEEYGTFERLRRKGFDPYLSFHPLDSERYILHITDTEIGAVLIELVCRITTLKAKNAPQKDFTSEDLFDLLAVEWLLMQNPKIKFTLERPQLPGQKHPGLGIGREIITLLQIMTERLEKDGMLAIPAHYHNGVLYNHSFRFFSPEKEAELKALERDLVDLTLAQASWAIEQGSVLDKQTGKIFQWHPEEMIWSKSKKLDNYFVSNYYSETFEKNFQEKTFCLAHTNI